MPDSPALAVHSTAAQLNLAGDLVNIVFWRHDLVTNRLHFDDHGFTVLGIPHCAAGLTLEESRSYTHSDDVAKLAASAAQALLTDLPVDVETRHRRSDGIWRHMLVRRVVERNAAGEAVAFVGVSLDVTERHQAATALNAASARCADCAQCRHRHLGNHARRRPGPLGRADVPAARPRTAPGRHES